MAKKNTGNKKDRNQNILIKLAGAAGTLAGKINVTKKDLTEKAGAAMDSVKSAIQQVLPAKKTAKKVVTKKVKKAAAKKANINKSTSAATKTIKKTIKKAAKKGIAKKKTQK